MANGKGRENRRFLRVQPAGLVAKTGKVFLDSRTPGVECRVIDLSRGGACLEFSKALQLPRRFDFVHGGVRKNCLLVWQRNFRAGVSF